MNLRDVVLLQETLDIYNEYLYSNSPTPIAVMKNILNNVHDNCTVLNEKYKGYKFRVKNYMWPPSEDNWTLHDTEYTLLELKLVYNRNEWSIRFMYEIDSTGGYGVNAVAQCYSRMQC